MHGGETGGLHSVHPPRRALTSALVARRGDTGAVLGELLTVGRTSQVFAYGRDSVAKVLEPHVPNHWAAVEARLSEAARALGVPAPEVRDLIEVNGCPTIVFERIVGPSMWELMSAEPHRCPTLIADFSAMQREIHAAGVPERVPSLVDRMSAKIGEAVQLPESDRSAAASFAQELPRGAALLHGDFHPGNVLVVDAEMFVIDWFDASVGHPVADIVRSSLLLRSADATDLRHLPGADAPVLDALHDGYVDAMSVALRGELSRLATWEVVIAASRLAERTDTEVDGLLAMCAARDDESSRLRDRLSPRE